MASVTYIIPLNEYNENVQKFLSRASSSIESLGDDRNCMLVGPEKVINEAATLFKEKVDLVYNEEKTDFCNQINKAVFFCKTPYFSVLEFDDEYRPYWQSEALKYANSDISVLLPLSELNKGNDPLKLEFRGFINEIVWNPTFIKEDEGHELGYVGMDELEGFMDFSVSGALIKTEDFISFGGLKPSLKLAAWYEFLLRTCHNGKKIFVVPKVGYRHTIGRDGSYTSEFGKSITPEEGQWLITTAKQEYFFKEDRNKTFNNEA